MQKQSVSIHYLEARTNGGGPAHRVLENKADQLKDARGIEREGVPTASSYNMQPTDQRSAVWS